MKLLNSTLKLHIETWDDPGDYPNGLASGPLPSKQFVESVEGRVTVQLEPSDIDSMEGDISLDSLGDYLTDNAGSVDHGMPGLRVKRWGICKLDDTIVTLDVSEFEAGVPERDYDE